MYRLQHSNSPKGVPASLVCGLSGKGPLPGCVTRQGGHTWGQRRHGWAGRQRRWRRWRVGWGGGAWGMGVEHPEALVGGASAILQRIGDAWGLCVNRCVNRAGQCTQLLSSAAGGVGLGPGGPDGGEVQICLSVTWGSAAPAASRHSPPALTWMVRLSVNLNS